MQISKKIVCLILLLVVAITCVVAIFSIEKFSSLKYLDTVEKYCKKWEVDVYVVLATIEVESGGNPTATSSVGAIGLMQLMPDTAKWIAEKIGIEVDDYYEEETNVMLGVAYISYLSKKFKGDTLYCAYNAGEGTVQKWLENGGEIKYPETKNYLNKIKITIRKLKNYIYLY